MLSFLALPDSCAGSQLDSTPLVPCGDTFCCLLSGAEAGSLCFATPRLPQIRAKDLREERDSSCLPRPPLPPPCCPRPCWNVTGVMARACPNSRNTRFSPKGCLQPPALFGLMGVGRGLLGFFNTQKATQVTVCTDHCGGCCPHAAAQLITGASQSQEAEGTWQVTWANHWQWCRAGFCSGDACYQALQYAGAASGLETWVSAPQARV